MGNDAGDCNSHSLQQRKSAWYAVGTLTLAYVVSSADRQILSLLIEPIRHDLGITDTQIGLLAGIAFALFYTFFGIPIAYLADRKSRKLIIAAGILTWSLMTALCGFARNFNQLFLARVGVGIGEATLSPAAHSMIADSFPPAQLGRAMGVYTLGSAFGPGIALLSGAAVIALVGTTSDIALPYFGVMQPWRLAFICVGLPGVLVALLMLTVREPARQRAATDSPTALADEPTALPFSDTWVFLKNQSGVYMPLFIGYSLVVLVLFAILTWVPAFFMRTYGWSAAEIGLAVGTLMLIFGGAGAVIGGWASDYLRMRGYSDAPIRATIVGLLILTPAVCLMPLVGDPVLSLSMLAVALIPLFGIGALMPTAFQTITPGQFRAQISALALFSGNLVGMGLGPILVALITDYVFQDELSLGYSMALVVIAAAPLSAFILLSGVKRYRSRVEEMDAVAGPGTSG